MPNHHLPPIPISIASGISWPAIPSPQAASMLAMQYQLEVSQWWSPEVILQRQLEQISRLFYHAHRTVPFYKERLEKAGYKPGVDVTLELFRRVPFLKRTEIQEHGDALLSKSPPKDHGMLHDLTTSGSTGRPLRTWGTQMTQFFWYAMTLREHLWHQRDLMGKHAFIRGIENDGGTSDGWGPSTNIAFKTGKSASYNIKHDINIQLEWLTSQRPNYLLSYPSNIQELAKLSIEKNITIPSLKQIRTFAEKITQEHRELCKKAWGVNLVDAYSCQEAGYIALQCPDGENYHVQSETVFVEILDDAGAPCRPGQPGKVVITPLHNFAMPLIRYENFDYAVPGERCACDRGLPVLTKIHGRQRNMVTLPNGTKHWPHFPARSWMHIGQIRQIQLVQKSLTDVQVHLVAIAPLNAPEEKEMTAVLQSHLGYPFRVSFHYVDEIKRGSNYKFEDFVSEVAWPIPHGT